MTTFTNMDAVHLLVKQCSDDGTEITPDNLSICASLYAWSLSPMVAQQCVDILLSDGVLARCRDAIKGRDVVVMAKEE